MRIIKHKIVDVYYNKKEEKKAKIYGKHLLSAGYTLEHEDDGNGEYEYCDQYYSKPILTEKGE